MTGIVGPDYITQEDNGEYYIDIETTMEDRDYLQEGMIIRANTRWGEQGFRLTNPKRKNIGVIFADLNGLKKMNDSCGHSAGDLLLQNAAKILKEVFPNDEIFRAGGDEFMVLMRNTTEEVLAKKEKEIKRRAEAIPNVHFATGICFDNECNNIHQAMKIADGRMYQDKKHFYELHPELRRPTEVLREF